MPNKNEIELTPGQKAIKEAIQTCLTPDERLIAILFYVEEMTVEEIAETLEIETSEVELQYCEILLKLREATYQPPPTHQCRIFACLPQNILPPERP